MSQMLPSEPQTRLPDQRSPWMRAGSSGSPANSWMRRIAASIAGAYLHAVGHFAHWLTEGHLTLRCLDEGSFPNQPLQEPTNLLFGRNSLRAVLSTFPHGRRMIWLNFSSASCCFESGEASSGFLAERSGIGCLRFISSSVLGGATLGSLAADAGKRVSKASGKLANSKPAVGWKIRQGRRPVFPEPRVKVG